MSYVKEAHEDKLNSQLFREEEEENNYITEDWMDKFSDILDRNTSFIFVGVFLWRTLC